MVLSSTKESVINLDGKLEGEGDVVVFVLLGNVVQFQCGHPDTKARESAAGSVTLSS